MHRVLGGVHTIRSGRCHGLCAGSQYTRRATVKPNFTLRAGRRGGRASRAPRDAQCLLALPHSSAMLGATANDTCTHATGCGRSAA